MSLIVKIGKKGKRILKKFIQEKTHICYTRRLERIQTDRRICAMTFDDGPMDLPAVPDAWGGKALTDVLLDTLKEYGAKGTFDIIGDTSQNYPDEAGKLGSAAWGGTRYDHYPDIGKDEKGGAVHNDRLIRRIIEEGHQLTNHGYRHIIFGKKPFVYGAREYLGSLPKAYEDIKKLHTFIKEKYGYEMTMSRPAHYVDQMQDGFNSYDVYDQMGYQYMAASFDGAGWLPSVLTDERAALEAEVNAMVQPIKAALEQDPDFFCGQIIFQKDGYNMMKRTPVAYGLGKQLALLKEYGYQVVTVAELVEESPFADVGRNHPLFKKLVTLSKERGVVYSDNKLRLDGMMTQGELAMLLCPKEESLARRNAQIQKSGKTAHRYWGAMDWCVEQGILPKGTKPDAPVTALPEEYFEPCTVFSRGNVYQAYKM